MLKAVSRNFLLHGNILAKVQLVKKSLKIKKKIFFKGIVKEAEGKKKRERQALHSLFTQLCSRYFPLCVTFKIDNFLPKGYHSVTTSRKHKPGQRGNSYNNRYKSLHFHLSIIRLTEKGPRQKNIFVHRETIWTWWKEAQNIQDYLLTFKAIF